jgi:2-dehydropantoate 2-reductase
MKIAILGAGAMGGLFGGFLTKAGNDVILIDVWREAVESMRAKGLRIDNQREASEVIPVQAQTDPAKVGPVDLVVVLVKCVNTEKAVQSSKSLLGPETVVVTLQNGWGNASRIAKIVGAERVLAGVTYHSATVLGPGHLRHTGGGATYIGELSGNISNRLLGIGEIFKAAGLEVVLSENITREIWSKLLLAACTLPTSALLGFTSGKLIEHQGTMQLMRGILHEAIEVARAQGINLDETERWKAITDAEKHYAGAKASMLQDIENRRHTEIDVVNGAIVEAGKQLNIPTPHNEDMVWLIKSLEETFDS